MASATLEHLYCKFLDISVKRMADDDCLEDNQSINDAYDSDDSLYDDPEVLFSARRVKPRKHIKVVKFAKQLENTELSSNDSQIVVKGSIAGSQSALPVLISSSPGLPKSTSLPSVSSDNDFYSEYGVPPPGYKKKPKNIPSKMIIPRMAKEISVTTRNVLIRVTAVDPNDRIQEEDDCADGFSLFGFCDGLALYRKVTNLDEELQLIQTETINGPEYVAQPIETCFSKKGAGFQPMKHDSGFCPNTQLAQLAVNLPPNRTFSNKWFTVKLSPLGGFGVFAKVHIPRHTHILLEQPFFTLKEFKALKGTYRAQNEEEKAVFDGLHGYHKDSDDAVLQKWNANHFYLTGNEGIFAIASNFNHACHSKRNAQYRWDIRRGVMTFTTTMTILEDDEILISYGASRRHLFDHFGFVCHCGVCEHEEWAPPTNPLWQF